MHNKVTTSKGERFNHNIERLHNNIRQRTKNFGRFKNLDSAYVLMKGYEISYNFIRKHQTLGCCPFKVAIPKLELKSENKWLELIGLSKM